MPLNREGFSIIDLPPIDENLLKSFESLSFDEYMGKNRYRRFSQYRVSNTQGWMFEKLPQRPYVTYSKYNSVAGGIKRYYQPIIKDFTSIISVGLDHIGLGKETDWQINVHQYRVIVNDELEGITVPEGIHKDGHEYIMICVFKRHNITGGEMTLFKDIEGKSPFFSAVVEEGQAALLDDRVMFHDVSNINPTPGHTEGHRDIVVIALSKWSERWYGEDFEQDALTDTA